MLGLMKYSTIAKPKTTIASTSGISNSFGYLSRAIVRIVKEIRVASASASGVKYADPIGLSHD